MKANQNSSLKLICSILLLVTTAALCALALMPMAGTANLRAFAEEVESSQATNTDANGDESLGQQASERLLGLLSGAATADLGLSVDLDGSDYLGMSTAMGRYRSGMVEFMLKPSSDALVGYQAQHPGATQASMLEDWAKSITSFTFAGTSLTQRDYKQWLGEIEGPEVDAANLRYFDVAVDSSWNSSSRGYDYYLSVYVPVALFGDDDFSTQSLTIASAGFTTTTGSVTYRNYGADSITVRVLDKPAVDNDGNATDYKVLREYTLTDAELRALPVQSNVLTSANCGMAGLRTYKSEGVSLTDVLDAAGVDFGPGMTLITRTTDCASTNDGNGGTEAAYYGFQVDEKTGTYSGNGTFSYETLMGQTRYHYPAMWDDTTTYADLDGNTIYSYLSADKDAWRATYKGTPEKAEALTRLIGASKVQVATPMLAWSWCEGVVAWGGTNPEDQSFGESSTNPYTAQERYRLLFGMTAEADGSLANDNTQFSNCYGVFGIDIIDPDYTPKTYAINYELNGGSNYAKNPTSYTVGSTPAIKDPTRVGYEFTGWYTDRALSQPFEGITERTTGDFTLYAGWELADLPKHDTVETDVSSFEVWTNHYGTAWETDDSWSGSGATALLDYQVINVNLTFDEAVSLSTSADYAALAKELEVTLNKSDLSDEEDYLCTYVPTVAEIEAQVKADPNRYRYTIGGLSDDGKTLSLAVYIGYAIFDGRLAVSCTSGGAQSLVWADGSSGHPLVQLATTIVPNGLEAHTVSARVATDNGDGTVTPAQTVTQFVAPNTAGRLVTRGKVHVTVLKNGLPVGNYLNGNWATTSGTHWHDYLTKTVNSYLDAYFSMPASYPAGLCHTLANLGFDCTIDVSGDQITLTASESEPGDVIEVFVSSYLNNGQLTTDKTALASAVDTAERLQAKGAPTGKEEAFALLENRLALAQASLASNYYSQDVVDEKTAALNEAINAIGTDSLVHTINYALNGGTNSSANPSTFVEGVGVTLANPTRDGYTFEGWYSDAACTLAVTAISSDETEDVTVFAKWEKINTEGFTVNDPRNTGITVTPELTVTGKIETTITVPDSTSAEYQTISARLGNDTMLGVFNIAMTVDDEDCHSNFGTLTLAFPVATALEGKTVTVTHLHADGTITSENVTVMNGFVTVQVTDLSTFMLSLPTANASDGAAASSASAKATSSTASTGDTLGSLTGICAFALVACAAILLISRRNKATKE